jgi:hypothetical protein
VQNLIDAFLDRFTDRPTEEEYRSILRGLVTQSQRAALLQQQVYVLEHKLERVNKALYPDVEF